MFLHLITYKLNKLAEEKFIIDCVIVSALAVCPKRERLSYDQRSRDGLRDERDFDWSYGND